MQNLFIYFDKFCVTALYKYWSVGCEATYLCLRQASCSKATVARSLLHYLCSQVPHSCSSLLQILEIILVHVVKQQLLYIRCVTFTLLIAASCFTFILSSSFTFWTVFLYLKSMFLIWISCVLCDGVLIMDSELETMWKSETMTYIRVLWWDVFAGMNVS